MTIQRIRPGLYHVMLPGVDGPVVAGSIRKDEEEHRWVVSSVLGQTRITFPRYTLARAWVKERFA